MASDRMNSIELALVTALKAETTVTTEAKTIERGYREDLYNFMDHELPALSVEAVEIDAEVLLHDASVSYERVKIIIEINYQSGSLATARQKIKKLICLVRDFLKSTAWARARDTTLGGSGFITSKENVGYWANGTVECWVSVNLGE